MVGDGAEFAHGESHIFRGDIAGFGDVERAADGDVGVHVLHFCEQVFGDQRVL